MSLLSITILIFFLSTLYSIVFLSSEEEEASVDLSLLPANRDDKVGVYSLNFSVNHRLKSNKSRPHSSEGEGPGGIYILYNNT